MYVYYWYMYTYKITLQYPKAVWNWPSKSLWENAIFVNLSTSHQWGNVQLGISWKQSLRRGLKCWSYIWELQAEDQEDKKGRGSEAKMQSTPVGCYCPVLSTGATARHSRCRLCQSMCWKSQVTLQLTGCPLENPADDDQCVRQG